ncbi:ATP-binding protein [Methanobrevibacter sp. OttesenSCG-928-K11]|nr:ATP-binding protein [Methanobrevibacter sp. OttesenSCG-928-K11]
MNSNNYLVNKVFYSYFLVSVLSILAMAIGTSIDSLVAGNLLGPQALAGLGISSPIVVFLSTISGILGSGALALATVLIGEDKLERINPIFTVTMLLAIVFSIIFSIICCIETNTVAILLGASGSLVATSSEYIFGLSLGFLPIVLSFLMLNFIRMDGSKNLPMYSIIVMTVVNITLDLIFAGPLQMGMFGLALATVISYLASFLICCIHFFTDYNSLKIVSIKGIRGDLKKIFILGTPNALNRFSRVFRSLILNHLLMNVGGVVAVTAYAVQSTVNSIVSAVPQGIGQTLNFIEGIFYGERDKKALKNTLKISFKSGFLICIVLIIIIFLFTKDIANLFGTGQGANLDMVTIALKYLAISLPFSVVCEGLISFYQSTHNTKMSNFVGIAHNVIFMFVTALILTPFFYVDGVWISLVFGEILTIVAVYLIVSIKYKNFSFSLDNMMMLPKTFDEEITQHIDFSIGNDMDEIIKASHEIHKFCLNNEFGERESYLIALSIEELAGNIIKHGFDKDNSKQFLDIRIIKTEDEIIFRLRDDGVKFNPLDYVEEIKNKENSDSALGIKLMMELVSNADYRYTIGTNNLTLHIKL